MSIYKQIKAYDDTFFNKNVSLNSIGGETKIVGDLTSKKNVYLGELGQTKKLSIGPTDLQTLQSYVRTGNTYDYTTASDVYYLGRDYYLQRDGTSTTDGYTWRYEKGAYFWHTESYDEVIVALKQPEGTATQWSGANLNNGDGHARWVYIRGRDGGILGAPPLDGTDGPSNLVGSTVFQHDLTNSVAIARTSDGIGYSNIFDGDKNYAGNQTGSLGGINIQFQRGVVVTRDANLIIDSANNIFLGELNISGGLEILSTGVDSKSIFKSVSEFKNDISYNNGAQQFSVTASGVSTNLPVDISNTLVVREDMTVNNVVNETSSMNANLNVSGKTVVVGDVVLNEQLRVEGTMVTANSEEVFIGDNHITLNSGSGTSGEQHGGIVSVYEVIKEIGTPSGITFQGSWVNRVGSIKGLNATDATDVHNSYQHYIIKITGADEYDGFYLISDTDRASGYTDMLTLYSDGWYEERMPFLNEVFWGDGKAVSSDVTKPDAKAVVVGVNHLLVHGGQGVGGNVSHVDGKLYVCNGSSRSDFYDSEGVWRYQEVGSTPQLDFEEVALNGEYKVSKQVTSVTGVGSDGAQAILLSKYSENGDSFKVVNNTLSTFIVKTEGEGGMIDGSTEDFTLYPGQHITVVKYEDGDQNATVDKWAIM